MRIFFLSMCFPSLVCHSRLARYRLDSGHEWMFVLFLFPFSHAYAVLQKCRMRRSTIFSNFWTPIMTGCSQSKNSAAPVHTCAKTDQG